MRLAFALALVLLTPAGAAAQTERILPLPFRMHIDPANDARSPYAYRFHGRIRLPAGASEERCRGGRVVVRLPSAKGSKFGRGRLKSLPLNSSCRYSEVAFLPRRLANARLFFEPALTGAEGLRQRRGRRVYLTLCPCFAVG